MHATAAMCSFIGRGPGEIGKAGPDVFDAFKANELDALPRIFHDLRLNTLSYRDLLPHVDAALDQGVPDIDALFLEQEDLRLPAAGLPGRDPAGEDLGIVHDQQITRPEMLDKVCKDPVPDGSAPPVEDQQTGPVPLLRRGLGDKFLGQLVIKVRKPELI